MNLPNRRSIICAAVLALAFCVSLALRTAVPWEHVFPGAWIKCTDNDAYFYMRLLDNLSSHFPLLGSWDPYGIYPDGRDLSGQPLFFVYLMGFVAWLLGGGAPSQQVVDLVGVWFPAVLGALLVFPVFLIGRCVFNKWAGLAAAGFIALMPGEFLIRTLLGNADSHALEIFLSTLFMLFLALSGKAGAAVEAVPPGGTARKMIRPAVYGALAGLLLGLYILTWQGAVLFVLISFLWLVVQAVSDHLRGRPLIYLGVTGLAVYIPALLLSLAGPSNILAMAALGAALFTAPALPALSLLLRRFKLKAIIYPAVLLALGMAGLLALSAAAPGFFKAALERLTFFFAWNPHVTIAEMRPLLIDRQGNFTLALLWGNYTSASLLAAVALAAVLYRAVRQGRPEVVLLAVWSVITLLSALAMQRFAYYLAINAAVLAGYTCWLILRLCGLREGGGEAVPAAAAGKKSGSGKKARARRSTGGNPALKALGIAAVAFLIAYPNTGPLPGGEKPCFDVASKALYPPSDAWCESMDWLREETPQPFGKAGYYYDYYGGREAQRQASYSVLCWWDYGYWVLRMGQRVPVSHPGASTVGEHNYFMAAGGREAAQAGAGWNMKYVAVNDYLVDWDTGFSMVASAAGGKAAEYYDIYYRPQNGRLAPTLLYYPEYYRTMAVRLYCFDGKEYTPSETAVISWEEKTDADGQPYREISGLKAFRSYADASAFLSAQQTGNWRIVGKDPLASPVPLEALEEYRPAFASSQKVRIGGVDLPEVKIFEYKENSKL